MYCKRCGEQIPEESEFCPVCGEKQGTISEEKEEKGSVGKVVGRILKGAVVIGTPIVAVAGEEILNCAGKTVKKKAKKMTNKVLKKVGLKKKTPLDKGAEVMKKMKKAQKK